MGCGTFDLMADTKGKRFTSSPDSDSSYQEKAKKKKGHNEVEELLRRMTSIRHRHRWSGYLDWSMAVFHNENKVTVQS